MQTQHQPSPGPRQPVRPAPAPATPGLGWLRFILVLSAATPLLLFMAFAGYRSAQLEHEAEVRLQRALAISHEHAMRVLDTNDSLLRHVLTLARPDDDALLEGRRERLHDELSELSRNKPQIQSIWIQDADGNPLATDRIANLPAGLNFSDREYFKWHKAGGQGVYVTEPLVGKATKERFFDISLGRWRRDGSFAGLVSVSMFPSYFTAFHAKLAEQEPGLAITLFRRDGAVYSRWPPLADDPQRMSDRSETLARVKAGETAGVVRSVSSLDKQKRLILFRKLGDYPIYLGVGREFSAIRAALLNELGTIAAFGALPTLGIFVVAFLAMRRTREALAAAGRLQHESLARRKVEEALLQSQKMEALGRLTGGVAHDFNNALMIISGNLHLLRLTQPGAPPKYADAIARAVDSAAKLTRQLLAFSRRQALVPETILLQRTLPALRDLIHPTLGSHVDLAIEVDPDTRPIHVDVAELELALINLAVNANDAMSGGGHLKLVAGNVPDDAGEGSVPRVFIEARDTGHGMDAATLERVFEPFFTTKPLGRGTGLGLSQVYGLCQRAGGVASVRSEPGAGTTVRLEFPASSDLPAEDSSTTARDPVLRRSVLLVEDNPDVAAVVLPLLQRLECRVVHLDCGQSAINWLRSAREPVDILLSDVVMPGEVDGVALARHVREHHPATRILLMTGYAEQLDAISAAGFEVLPKPFSPRALAEALERLVDADRADSAS